MKVGWTTYPSQSFAGGPQAENACAVYINHGDMTKLYLYTNSNGGSDTLTPTSPAQAVPFTLAGAVRCRLYLYGANTPAGVAAGGAVAKLYCNGVLVATSTTTMPTVGQQLYFGAGIQNHTASVANGLNVGPIKVFWNSSIAGDPI